MISNYSLIIALTLSALTLNAQNKLLTIQDAVLKGRSSLAPKRLQNISFVKGSNQFYYVDGTVLKTGDNSNGKTSDVLALSSINLALKTNQLDTLSGFPMLSFSNPQTIKFTSGKTDCSYNLQTKVLTKSTPLQELSNDNAEQSPNEKYVAYTRDNNLYVSHPDGVEDAVSKDGSYTVVFGKSVHRDEFGISKGTFWSPKSNFLAFYKMDQSDVTDYPIIDWSKYPAQNKNIKYPMAGNKSHYVTLGIYDVAKKSSIYIKTEGPKDQYLTNIAWSPDEKFIYIAIVNRAQNQYKLNEYDRASGNFVRTLLEESDEKYTEPLHEIQFVKNNPTQFIWESRKDGYRHLYLYDISGKLIRQLTKGNWEVKALNGFDVKGERFFFHANDQGPVNQDFYSVTLKTGEIKRLTYGNGFHTAALNETCDAFIDNFTSVNVPREYNIIQTASKKAVNIFKADNPVKDYKLGAWKLFTIKNKEGIDLYARLFKPVDFDSTKKYPVLVYLYNGPHSQMVTNTWMAGGELWYQYMAQKGFIVFTVDGRGTSYRGKAFEQATFRQLGQKEMEDQLAGVDYLKSLAYVDANRIGVHGWSFGGFMTTSLMTHYPGVYKVAAAGGPVIDWSYYEIMYTERYMDTPQENKEGYDKTNLLSRVDKLKGRLLMIHGAQDDVVVWQHSMLYAKKAVDKGVQMDYYMYPGHFHNVLGKDRAHLMEKICNYFIEHL
jgi:dipeptidyl-peptidase 4